MDRSVHIYILYGSSLDNPPLPQKIKYLEKTGNLGRNNEATWDGNRRGQEVTYLDRTQLATRKTRGGR